VNRRREDTRSWRDDTFRRDQRHQWRRIAAGTMAHEASGVMPPGSVARVFHQAWSRGFDLEGK
jgi:hypothetical protein